MLQKHIPSFSFIPVHVTGIIWGLQHLLMHPQAYKHASLTLNLICDNGPHHPWSPYPPHFGILVPTSSTLETTQHHANLMNKSVVAQAICSILCRLALLFLNSNQWRGQHWQQIINYYKLTSQSNAPYHIIHMVGFGHVAKTSTHKMWCTFVKERP